MRPIQVIETMPLTPDDVKWIKRIISAYDFAQQNNLLTGYIKQFSDAYEKHPDELRKGNVAAFIANNWLRAKCKGVEQIIVKNCTTCEYLAPSGTCAFYNMVPPASFLSVTKQECTEWLLETPF